jgi:hypothetical protein
MHFCAEELMAITSFAAMVPFIGPWLLSKLKRKQQCPCGHGDGERHA